MKIKVREVGASNEKSQQEIEQDLLNKHQQENNSDNNQDDNNPPANDPPNEDPPAGDPPKGDPPSSEINDEAVLSYFKNKYDKDIDSIDSLFSTNEPAALPEDIDAYLKYKKETGRGLKDFVNLQRDYDEMGDDRLLANYYQATEEGLDAEDIRDIIEDRFSYDEDLDDEKDIKRKKLAKKRELNKARKHLNSLKDKYKTPLESSGGGMSEEQKKDFEQYKSYVEESNTVKEANKKKYDWFLEKTNEVFNEEFKGFEFEIDESSFTFKPGDATELKNLQSDVNNFVNKFMDKDTGMMKDAKGYHRAMAMAMNPDKFAKFFYEQGVASAVDNDAKKSKNINMNVRATPQSFNKNGLKIRSVDNESSGRGLKIKSKKNN